MTTPKQGYPFFLQWAGYSKTGDFIGVVGNRASRAFGKKVLDAMRQNPALHVESLFVWFNGWILTDTRLTEAVMVAADHRYTAIRHCLLRWGD